MEDVEFQERLMPPHTNTSQRQLWRQFAKYSWWACLGTICSGLIVTLSLWARSYQRAEWLDVRFWPDVRGLSWLNLDAFCYSTPGYVNIKIDYRPYDTGWNGARDVYMNHTRGPANQDGAYFSYLSHNMVRRDPEREPLRLQFYTPSVGGQAFEFEAPYWGIALGLIAVAGPFIIVRLSGR
jgi:hypothetical protein